MKNSISELNNRLGFGAWQLGNREFWGEMSEEEGESIVEYAIDHGIEFFDTAPGYGSGISEKILGNVIINRRDQVFISSKFGHNADGTTNFQSSAIENSIKESLFRLQTHYLDCLLLHNPSMDILKGNTNHFQVLDKMKDKGLINSYGVSIDTFEELAATLKHTNVQVIEILFNVFFQSALPLFDVIKKRNILLVTKVPLDSGWLSGKYDKSSTFTGIRSRWDKVTIERRAKLITELKEICQDEDLTKYALAFILSFSAVKVVIPGMKTINNVIDNLKASEFELSKDIKQRFMALYEKEIANNPLPW